MPARPAGDRPRRGGGALGRGRLGPGRVGLSDVRLYHDNVLAKAPGCGRTPLHFDAHHFPIASRTPMNPVVSQA